MAASCTTWRACRSLSARTSFRTRNASRPPADRIDHPLDPDPRVGVGDLGRHVVDVGAHRPDRRVQRDKPGYLEHKLHRAVTPDAATASPTSPPGPRASRGGARTTRASVPWSPGPNGGSSRRCRRCTRSSTRGPSERPPGARLGFGHGSHSGGHRTDRRDRHLGGRRARAGAGGERIVGMARRPFDPAAHGWTKTEYRQGDILDRDAVDAGGRRGRGGAPRLPDHGLAGGEPAHQPDGHPERVRGDGGGAGRRAWSTRHRSRRTATTATTRFR